MDAGGDKFAGLLLLGPVPSSCGCTTGLGGGGMTLCAIIVCSNKWLIPLFQRRRRSLPGLIFIHRCPNGDEHPSGHDGVVSLLVTRVLLLHLLHRGVYLFWTEIYLL